MGLFAGENFGKQLLEIAECGDLVMNGTASKKRELSKRGKKPSTYCRIVTGNVNGKPVVQSDENLEAYEFKSAIPTPSFQDPAALVCTS